MHRFEREDIAPMSAPAGRSGIAESVEHVCDAERALRDSDARFRALFRNLPDFVCVVDRGGTVVLTNRDGRGVRGANVLGRSCIEFVAPEYRRDAADLLAAVVASGESQSIAVTDTDGVWWSCRVAPLGGMPCTSVMVIATDVTEQRRAQEAVIREQQVLRQLLEVHERERQLTSYEIHDGLAQQLTGSLCHLEAYARKHDAALPESPDLTRGLALLRDALGEARRLISDLRPPVLDDLGVVAAIEYLACEFGESGVPAIRFHHHVEFTRLAAPVEAALFRVAQESLRNACRHSRTARIDVSLRQVRDRVRLRVRDWGIGFDPAQVDPSRYGLRGIRHRARLLGGSSAIRTKIGFGTAVTVTLPLLGPLGSPPAQSQRAPA